MRVLLTGATGFLGRRVGAGLGNSHEVHAVARGPGQPAGPALRWLTADLARPESLEALPRRIDAVIHLAQSRHYREFPSRASDVFAINVASVAGLLDYARRSGARRFVLASAAGVYRRSDRALDERAPLDPRSFYERSKRMAELLAEAYAELLRVIVLRLFTVYGPGQRGMLVPTLIDRVREGEPIALEGERGLPLSPIWVDDAADAVRAALVAGPEAPGLEVLNVGGDERLDLRAMGHEIGRALRREPRFESTAGSEPAGLVADNSKMKRVLGMRDLVLFATGIARAVDSAA